MIVDALWRAYCVAAGLDPATPRLVERFGDSPALADELLRLILAGEKTATTGLVAEYEHDGVALPVANSLTIVLDGADVARCIIRTRSVEVRPFHAVDVAFAFAEGAGDRSLAFWRREHERYFRRRCAAIGIPWRRGLPVLCERFTLVWPR